MKLTFRAENYSALHIKKNKFNIGVTNGYLPVKKIKAAAL